VIIDVETMQKSIRLLLELTFMLTVVETSFIRCHNESNNSHCASRSFYISTRCKRKTLLLLLFIRTSFQILELLVLLWKHQTYSNHNVYFLFLFVISTISKNKKKVKFIIRPKSYRFKLLKKSIHSFSILF
jgi:hypothetical protein